MSQFTSIEAAKKAWDFLTGAHGINGFSQDMPKYALDEMKTVPSGNKFVPEFEFTYSRELPVMGREFFRMRMSQTDGVTAFSKLKDI